MREYKAAERGIFSAWAKIYTSKIKWKHSKRFQIQMNK